MGGTLLSEFCLRIRSQEWDYGTMAHHACSELRLLTLTARRTPSCLMCIKFESCLDGSLRQRIFCAFCSIKYSQISTLAVKLIRGKLLISFLSRLPLLFLELLLPLFVWQIENWLVRSINSSVYPITLTNTNSAPFALAFHYKK